MKMKREVIFRGWSPIKDMWLYGHGVHQGPERTYIVNGAGLLDEVEPETVGEWTGQHSNIGRKIFEGDVVSLFLVRMSFPGVVKFDEKSSAFCAWVGKKWIPLNIYDEFEILGNIFDDEDLKKKYREIYQK